MNLGHFLRFNNWPNVRYVGQNFWPILPKYPFSVVPYTTQTFYSKPTWFMIKLLLFSDSQLILNMKLKYNRDKVLKTAFWFLYVVLVFLSYFFMVWSDYINKRSNFSSDEITIDKHPLVTICFAGWNEKVWNRRMYELGMEITTKACKCPWKKVTTCLQT